MHYYIIKGGVDMQKRSLFVVLSAMFLFGWTGISPVSGAPFPSEPITLVIPVDPGGDADIFGRTMVNIIKTNKLVPVPMVVENKGGGSGGAGLGYMAQKRGNPYYLLSMPSNMLTTPLQNPGIPNYEQFTTICRLIFDDLVIAVNNKSPYKTMKDLVEAATRDPKGIRFAGASVGASDHLAMALIEKATGCKFNYIPFTNHGEVIAAILGGHVAVASLKPRTALQYAGKDLRILTACSEKRLPTVDVPTLREQGINVAHANFRGMYMSRDTSPEVRTYYMNLFTKLNETKEWKKFLDEGGMSPALLLGDDYLKWLVQENDKLRGVLLDLGMIKKK
jgi:putative tricarboxylic transport membrane protein